MNSSRRWWASCRTRVGWNTLATAARVSPTKPTRRSPACPKPRSVPHCPMRPSTSWTAAHDLRTERIFEASTRVSRRRARHWLRGRRRADPSRPALPAAGSREGISHHRRDTVLRAIANRSRNPQVRARTRRARCVVVESRWCVGSLSDRSIALLGAVYEFRQYRTAGTVDDPGDRPRDLRREARPGDRGLDRQGHPRIQTEHQRHGSPDQRAGTGRTIRASQYRRARRTGGGHDLGAKAAAALETTEAPATRGPLCSPLDSVSLRARPAAPPR